MRWAISRPSCSELPAFVFSVDVPLVRVALQFFHPSRLCNTTKVMEFPSRTSSVFLVLFLLLHNVKGQDDDILHYYSPFEPKDGSFVRFNADPSFIVAASKVVRPNTIYRACVFLTESSSNLTVKATVIKGKSHVSSATEVVDAGTSANLMMKIPGSITDGEYRLRVEGFDNQQTNKLVFKKEGTLEFHPEFLSIVVATNRKVYKNEMIVRMRIILTHLVDLKPYADAVTIYVMDPNGFIVRRWPSRYPTTGVVVLNYKLPAYPQEGEWTIRVEALAQVHDYNIIVERFYYYFFDVIPSAPAYVHDTDETYEAALTTSFHSGRVATGNLSLEVFARPIKSAINDYKLVIKDAPVWNAAFAYEVNLREIERILGINSLAGYVIRVAMKLYDFFQGESRDAFIETRIIHNEVKLTFAGPKTPVFKPGMPFEGHVHVTYNDDEALSAEKLSSARLTIKCFVTTAKGMLRTLPDIQIPPKGEYVQSINDPWRSYLEQQAEDALFEQFRTIGIHRFQFYIPSEAESIRITAAYIDADGEQVNVEQRAIAYYSPGGFYVHVTTSTEEAHFNNNAVIHLKSNFPFQGYHYLVTSKGLVVYGSTESTAYPTKSVTFSISVSTEMAPSFRVIVIIPTSTGELTVDSVTIPVISINRYKMNMTLVQNKDHSKQTVQVVTRTLPGSFVAVSLLRSTQFYFQADNTVTPSRIVRALYDMEPFTRSVYGVRWIDREGLQVDKVKYLTVPNPGPDSKRTFHFAGLLILTDAKVAHNPETASCDRTNGYEPCLAVGCYHVNQKCDKNADCADGSDEDDCPPDDDDRVNFRIFRRNRFHDFFDWLDGDWAWYDIPVTDDGFDFHDRPVTLTNEAWYLTAFTFHKDFGLAVLDQVLEYDGSLPFYITVESPPSIRRGETVGIRLLFINNMEKPAMALLILEESDDYAFVETGPYGEVQHYNPNVLKGERHHMIEVKAGKMFEVYFPISPLIERGTMTVNIRMMSQIFQQDLAIDIEVLPEGATITRHTSLLLDLKNRAHVLRFLDIPVEETPVIPYSKLRRYVFGSPRASITVCGDVFGPVFLESPISTSSYLRRSLKGTEANLFNLASTSWTLHYLRLTSQLTRDVLLGGLNDMNAQLSDLMRLYHSSGAFRSQTNSKPSVWATAWVVRVLSQSQFQDWENHYFVDGRLLSASVKWLLTFQSYDGSFDETADYTNPLDRREITTNSTGRIARTAHVLIALVKTIESLDGNLKVAAAFGKNRGFQYLERMLHNINDPYDLAITTHALTLANSPAQEAAFDKLHSIRRIDEGMIYWSRSHVPVNEIVYENQRPFLQPRLPNQQDALAVETTAYALLVYLARDSIGDLHERVVTWLNTMRMVDAGFVSIYDTIVAMEALTEYAYQARLREITAMTVVIDASASPNSTVELHIDRYNLAEVHHVEIPNVWGHVNLIGRGAGQAVVQLKVQYGIDWEELRDLPRRRFFDLYIEETYSHFRNKSHITVDVCVKWLATDESSTSGAVTLEVEMPSGYWVVQSDAEEVLARHTFLQDVVTGSDKIVWIMDRVGPEQLCFQYGIRRWFPVANMTMYRSAVVYETHSPENFEMQVFNATPLYVLDICEVCGSYQCPYCPYFSAARAILVEIPVLLFSASIYVVLYSKSV